LGKKGILVVMVKKIELITPTEMLCGGDFES
jgi:hypothetical protein